MQTLSSNVSTLGSYNASKQLAIKRSACMTEIQQFGIVSTFVESISILQLKKRVVATERARSIKQRWIVHVGEAEEKERLRN